jgi:glycosyltransferase involved in cell wall biosynthesis
VNKTPIATIPAAAPEPITQVAQSERWLFVDGASAFGGHEVMLLRWLEELHAQRSVGTFLMARRDSQLARAGERWASIIELPAASTRATRGIFGALRDMTVFVRAAFAVRPSVCIVAEGCLLAQPLFLLAGRLLGLRVLLYVPLLQTSASMGFGHGRLRDAIVRHVYSKLPHGWVTITREQGEDFRAWAGIKRPILVLQNTVSRAIEAAPIGTAGLTEPSSDMRLRIVMLGRLEPHQKGLDILLDHIAAHPELGLAVRLTFVGTGPFDAPLAERLGSDAALASWVTLMPWSPTIEIMHDHDVLLMTSRYEGVPLVMLEAMALGVPVVAPNFPGTRAFLTPECLFEPGDMNAAFRAVESLVDADTRADIAERNRATFQARASNDAFANAVRALTPRIRALGHMTARSGA